jgi:SPP1 family phage portal protein
MQQFSTNPTGASGKGVKSVNIAELEKALVSPYALTTRTKAMQMFDLYTNNHAILEKPNKVVAGKTFRTTKLPLNMYQLVVQFVVDYLLSQPISVSHSDEQFQELINEFHKLNRVRHHNRKLLEAMCVFGNAFEHFFVDEEGNPRLRLIDNMAAIPYYDEFMNLEMFIEEFKVQKLDGTEQRICRVFTKDTTTEFTGEKDTWLAKEENENLFGLPVIGYVNAEFHRQIVSDIEQIQPLVEELEKVLSDFGDTIKYHADPILVAFGQKLPDLPARAGKILNFEKGADVKYLTWDQNVGAIEYYVKQLKELIFELTMTPKVLINPATVSNLSGVALRIMYSPASIKANAKELTLTSGMMKRYELLAKYFELKTGRKVDLSELDINFARTVPTNESELINSVLMMYSAGLISKETALQLAPYVEDPKAELEKMNEENEDVYVKQWEQELSQGEEAEAEAEEE